MLRAHDCMGFHVRARMKKDFIFILLWFDSFVLALDAVALAREKRGARVVAI